MGQPKRRKRTHKGTHPALKKYKTKRRVRDVDQVEHDVLCKQGELLNQPIDEDKTGEGQHYCVCCVRYFISDEVLKLHKTSKQHKQKLKLLKNEAYSIEESNRAAGMGSYFAPKKRRVIENEGGEIELLDKIEMD